MTQRLPFLLVAAALPLAGCVSFGEKPPATLMTLTADSEIRPGQTVPARDGTAVTVLVPTVPQALNVLRVPVQTGETSIAYLKDAQWVEPPARLFRNLLAETIAVRTGRPVLDIRQYSLAPGARVSGRLQKFGLDGQSKQVVVVYDAALARGGVDRVETRRFEAKAPVSSEDGPGVSAALNRAANQVAVDAADWIGRAR